MSSVCAPRRASASSGPKRRRRTPAESFGEMKRAKPAGRYRNNVCVCTHVLAIPPSRRERGPRISRHNIVNNDAFKLVHTFTSECH